MKKQKTKTHKPQTHKPPKPNKTRIALLVHALRTTKRKQTTRILEDNNGNCCLGIACRVAMRHGLNVAVTKADNGYVSFDGVCGVLPLRVQYWYGFSASNPHLSSCGNRAIFLNDVEGYSFKQIADEFEKSFLKGKGKGTPK